VLQNGRIGARPGSLTVVGSGIKSVAHLTAEARARIQWADQVLHCVADGVTDAYIRELNPSTEDLHVYYGQGKRRRQTYLEMADRIVSFVRRGLNVVVVMYGHPGVFVHPTYAAMDTVSSEGYRTEMLPGICAEDCLIADLRVDPALEGFQTYEATAFLVRKRVIDVHVPMVLWQVGCVGDSGYNRQGFDGRHLHVLIERLQELYERDHEVVIYEAAQHPLADPRIHLHPLSKIGVEDVTGISTMFVPPLAPAPVDREMASRLGLL
jgi:uncharacterized protein YabN with tetrapyrrole methylase and pyrophosphatase domain